MITRSAAAHVPEEDRTPTNRQLLAQLPRPRVVIAGPETLRIEELRELRFALEQRKAHVTTFRMTDEFRMQEFRDAVESSAWVLIAVNERPARELELLRIVEHAGLPLPQVGIICLAHRVDVSPRLNVAGRIDLVVKRTPGDRSFAGFTHTRTMLLAEHLDRESDAASIARAVFPQVRD